MKTIDEIAARRRRGEAITLDQHHALTAAGAHPNDYAKLGRGKPALRRGDAGWHLRGSWGHHR